MLGYLTDVFSKVLTLIMSTTITPNILDYIRVSLKLPPPSRIYRLPLDRLNLKYMVYLIQKLGFQELAFFVPKDGPVGLILKIMVFVNKIEDAIRLEKYLRSRLPDCVRNKKQAFVIIQAITSNLDANIRTRAKENLWYRNTQICICIECAGMGINILDIMRAVQFKIPDFISLSELLQRLGQKGRDKSHALVTLVFIHPSQVLPDDVHMLEQSAFKNLWLPVRRENCEQITNVIA